MARRISISEVSVKEALSFCQKQGTPAGERTNASKAILNAILNGHGLSAEVLARQAGCGRKHVFALLKIVRARLYNQLVGFTFRRDALLNSNRLGELKRKLGNEFTNAKDVLVWYESWSGKTASLSAVYKWCQAASRNSRPFRSLPKLPKSTPARKALTLSPAEIEELKARRAKEIEADKIEDPAGFGGPFLENPALRITAILEYASGNDTMINLAKRLGVDVGRWVRHYVSVRRDLDQFCAVQGSHARARRG